MTTNELFPRSARWRYARGPARLGVADALAFTVSAALCPAGVPPEEWAAAEAYDENAYAATTRRGYGSDWRRFCAFCVARGYSFLPADPDVVRGYLAAHAHRGYKSATLERWVAAIAWHHRQAGHTFATQRMALHNTRRGIRRTLGTAPVRKAAITTPMLRAMVRELPDTALGLRDRALLLLGFAGAFRRSELVAVDVAHLEFEHDGIQITVPRSKTDQYGVGQLKGVGYGAHLETCPVRTLREWLDRFDIQDGPVFRAVSKAGRVLPRRLSDRAVARVVKQAVAPVAAAQAAREWDELRPEARDAAGGSAAATAWHSARARTIIQSYAGHSLRAGFVTAAATADLRPDEIAAQTHHRSLSTLATYIRDARPISAGAAAKLKL